ncbi:hypothetical protein Tco_0271130 [Tanacetum coccineum]
MPELMRDGLFARMVMEHRDDAGRAKRRLSWRLFILALGLHTGEEVESLSFARFAAWRKSRAHISGGQFVSRLPEHFGLLTAEILRGLTAWVAMGSERQPDDAAGAPRVAQDAPIVDEGGQADPTPVQAPPPPPAAARSMPQRMARLAKDVHEIRGALTAQHEVIDAMARDFSRFSTWAVTGLARMMDREGVTYVPYF